MKAEDQSKFWEDIYIAEDTGWDLSGPTPVFHHLSSKLNIGDLCIIGCGRGYDAIMFAKKGFSVTAVDFAPSAIHALKKMASESKVKVNALEIDMFSLMPNNVLLLLLLIFTCTIFPISLFLPSKITDVMCLDLPNVFAEECAQNGIVTFCNFSVIASRHWNQFYIVAATH